VRSGKTQVCEKRKPDNYRKTRKNPIRLSEGEIFSREDEALATVWVLRLSIFVYNETAPFKDFIPDPALHLNISDHGRNLKVT
jgi:hypothetical protein